MLSSRYGVVSCIKQKTGYEMRFSDWSSDVCASDLLAIAFSVLVYIQSGLVTESIDLTMDEMRVLLIMALGVASFTACMFTHNFIEDDRMDKRMRRLLP